MSSIIFGATGMVGGQILRHLDREATIAVSRSVQTSGCQRWLQSDLTRPGEIHLPDVDTIYCATNAILFAAAIDRIAPRARRIVVISSTSVFTKTDSDDAAEREYVREFSKAETIIIHACEERGTEWTILRPTLIYKEGRDKNVTTIASVIRKLGFMPLCGLATGLRQPVHAEDLALGAIAAAASARAANRAYSTPGCETISYREMVGRVFDGMGRKRRCVPLPPPLWKAAFSIAKPIYPSLTPAMGTRMNSDMAFDCAAARADFGWTARKFRPRF